MEHQKNNHIEELELEAEQAVLPAKREQNPTSQPDSGEKISLWQRLPRFRDEQQKKAGKNLLRFFILLLILTLVARGTAGATLPYVNTTRAEAGEIVQRVRGTGTVRPVDSVAVDMPAGITILQVPVSAGQAVAAGDVLAQFDEEELKEALQRGKTKLSELELELQQLQRTNAHDGSGLDAAKLALKRAQQDYDATKAQGIADVAAAQQALDEARAAEQNALDVVNGIADVASQEYSDAYSDWEAKTADVAAKEQALASAQSTADANLQTASRVLEDAKIAVENAQAADAEARQKESDESAKNSLALTTLQLDIEAQRETVEQMQALADNGGKLLATAGGTLLEVPPANTLSSAESPFRLADAAGGFETEMWIDKKDAEKLTPGDACEVAPLSSSYYQQVYAGRVTAVGAAGDDGSAKVTVRLLDGEWKNGQSVTVQAVQDRQTHRTCVPLSALHAASDGYYILVLQESSTVLGTEIIAAQVPVTVVAQDSQMAAIEGAFDERDDIITSSDKTVQPGDRVRVAR